MSRTFKTMKYNSHNGYTGIFEAGNFFGYKHYDLTIFKTETKQFYFHATYSVPITFDNLKEQVDTFPEFYKRLTGGDENEE